MNTAGSLLFSLLAWVVLIYLLRRAAPALRHDAGRVRGRLFGRRGGGPRRSTRADRALARGSTAPHLELDQELDDDSTGYVVLSDTGSRLFPAPGINVDLDSCTRWLRLHHDDYPLADVYQSLDGVLAFVGSDELAALDAQYESRSHFQESEELDQADELVDDPHFGVELDDSRRLA